MVHRLSGDLWYPMDYGTGDAPPPGLLRHDGRIMERAPGERASPGPEAEPGTLAIVAGLLTRMRRFKREVLQMRKHGRGHQLESSDGNSGALGTAQGGQLSCRTVTEPLPQL